MKKLLFATLFAVLIALAQDAAPKLAGAWQMTLETDHGSFGGAMDLKQEGSQLTGSIDGGAMGKVPVTGEAQGRKVTLSLAMHGGEITLKLNGAIQGNKMSGDLEGMAGKWSATR